MRSISSSLPIQFIRHSSHIDCELFAKLQFFLIKSTAHRSAIIRSPNTVIDFDELNGDTSQVVYDQIL